MAITEVFWDWGQSNRLGKFTGSIPEGIPLAAVRMWNNAGLLNDVEDWAAFRSANARSSTKHGTELQRAIALNAAGVSHAIIKIAESSTSVFDWLPAATDHVHLWDVWAATAASALAALPTEYPGRTFRHWLFPDQGEQDSFNNTDANAWPTGFAQLKAAMEGVIGQPFAGVLGIRTRADSGDVGACALLRAHQAAAYTAYIDADDVAVGVDGVHYTAPATNILGALEALSFLSIINMTISHGTATRTAVADTVVDRIDAGSGAGKIVIRSGTSVLATVILADPAFGNAASGVAALLGVPLDDASTGSGDADNFLAQDSDGNTVFAGSVTATGGSGDLTLNTITIVAPELVTITGGAYTAPP